MPFHNVKDVGEQRKQLQEIIFSCWPACAAPDPEHPDMPFTVRSLLHHMVGCQRASIAWQSSIFAACLLRPAAKAEMLQQ